MKKLLTLALALVALVSISWAATNLNSSRSNIYRMVYDTTAVTSRQAAAVLKKLDEIGPEANEATIRRLLQQRGVNLSLIKKIAVSSDGKGNPCILILRNPAHEAAARPPGDP